MLESGVINMHPAVQITLILCATLIILSLIANRKKS